MLVNTVKGCGLGTYADPRLAWDPSDFGDVKSIYVNIMSLWWPNNGITNTKTLQLIFPTNFNSAKVAANGTVDMSIMFLTESRCVFDVANFPFDVQKCTLDFFDATYDIHDVTQTGELFTKYQWDIIESNGEWTIQNVSINYTLVEQGDAYFNYDYLQFTFILCREPNFYIFVIAIPCFLLTLLSICGMFWTPNLKDEQLIKLSIGLTSMMSMTLFVDMVSQQIPKNTSFPLLGSFVIVDVFVISIACVLLVTLPCETSPLEKEKIKDREFNLSFNGFWIEIVKYISEILSYTKYGAYVLMARK
ncbi:unnamed protein product, partial [Mesorhabditis belari]|uniref:Neurotransmitter-gated ion-channel ligand-binding domain-containing protein n=1 Tax=Mesorhabditis belari TaxID=2138241 RepID=A0AAF3FS85_9BILA